MHLSSHPTPASRALASFTVPGGARTGGKGGAADTGVGIHPDRPLSRPPRDPAVVGEALDLYTYTYRLGIRRCATSVGGIKYRSQTFMPGQLKSRGAQLALPGIAFYVLDPCDWGTASEAHFMAIAHLTKHVDCPEGLNPERPGPGSDGSSLKASRQGISSRAN